MLALLRRWNSTKLERQAKDVCIEPILDNLAINNAADVNSCDRHFFPCRGQTPPRFGMGATNAKATNHLISLGDQIVNGKMEVGENRAEPGKILPILITTANLRTIRIVTNICWGVDLIDGSKIFLAIKSKSY